MVAPIAIFDSGVGGLTVLRAIREALPTLPTVYLGDTARVPYGTRSPATVRRYALNNARFLLEAVQPRMLVVACNTASAVALPDLQQALEIPVLGVIEPGARVADEVSVSRKVAVAGTRGTIASGAYQRALAALDPAIEFFGRPCPLFVPLAEEGWQDDPIAREVADRYLSDLAGLGVDTLVLGCTHYPLLAPAIAEAVGPTVRLVDSAHAVAAEVKTALGEIGSRGSEESTEHRCFVTDLPDAFGEVARRFLGGEPPAPELVDVPPTA
ncbi:MAG: glutamate racemase [Deltaproteobacteria bacterium]|nr:glutamate racemase [Deltaproteobacteria bacterium]